MDILKKIRLIFQNFPKTVINDLNKLCFQNYCASLHKNITNILSISFLKILGAKNNPVTCSSDQY